MNCPVCAFGKRLAQYLLRSRRTGGNGYNFAAVLLFLAQCFFECVCIRLIDFIRDVFADPRAALIELKRSILLRYLLDANQNLQKMPQVPIFNTAAAKRFSIAE